MTQDVFINCALGYVLGICFMFLFGVSISNEKMRDYKNDRWYALVFGSVVWPLFGGFWIVLKFWDIVKSNTLKDILFYEITKKKVEPMIWNPTRNQREARTNNYPSQPYDSSVTEPIYPEEDPPSVNEKAPIVIIGVKCGSKLK
jgi:hypothetical protein